MTETVQQRFYRKRRDASLCVRCGEPSLEGRVKCSSCTNDRKQYMDDRRDRGLCYGCPNDAVEGATHCTTCLFKSTARRSTGSMKNLDMIRSLWTGHCAVTGEPIAIGVNAHLDHIKPVSKFPELSASPSNLRWVHADVNFMKRAMSEERFLELCKKVVDFAP